MPIIHSTSSQLLVAKFESQRVDQVESAFRKSAEPTNITGVLWDLRLEEDDVNHGPSLASSKIPRKAPNAN